MSPKNTRKTDNSRAFNLSGGLEVTDSETSTDKLVRNVHLFNTDPRVRKVTEGKGRRASSGRHFPSPPKTL